MIFNRLMRKIKEELIEFFLQKRRVFFYSILSDIKIIALKNQPVLARGKGTIKIGNGVTFGVKESPSYYSTYTYLDVRRESSYIEIGDNCWINNNASIISDGKKIIIGQNCLIGIGLEIIDSDFHDLSPKNRFGGKNIIKKDVIINENVFIGNNVTILKGVIIGKNSVIGNGSVVTKNIPENVIAAGNPTVVIRQL